MNFHVKAKIQINLLDFSCQNTDAICNRLYLILPVKTTKPKSIFWILCQKVDLIWKKHEKTRLISLVKIQIQKNLIENLLVSLIKSHYKSIFFLHSIVLEFGCIFKYKFYKFLCSVIMTEIYEKCTLKNNFYNKA